MTTSHLNDAGKPQWPLTVLYDGKSLVSGHELEELKTKDKAGRLNTIDITKAGANVAEYGLKGPLGNDLYVRDAAGHTYTGPTALEAAYEAVGLGNYFRFALLPGFDCGPGHLNGH
ncbi:MAG TPA: hypothetical protein VL381_07940 [Rhodocyclaceae bacterium]|jgi:hypothetical protein|nr:hypothetical protein [Rhodocyclaceae bacterium]